MFEKSIGNVTLLIASTLSLMHCIFKHLILSCSVPSKDLLAMICEKRVSQKKALLVTFLRALNMHIMEHHNIVHFMSALDMIILL